MLIHNATIKREEKKANLVLTIGDKDYDISLTNDNPIEVKKTFNDFIVELKNGIFGFTLLDQNHDLYYYIFEEYIKQLNADIANVYSQLKKNDLINVPE